MVQIASGLQPQQPLMLLNSARGRLEPRDVAHLMVFHNGIGIISDYENFELKRCNAMLQTFCKGLIDFTNPQVIPVDFLIPKEFGSVKRDRYLWILFSSSPMLWALVWLFKHVESCRRHATANNTKKERHNKKEIDAFRADWGNWWWFQTLFSFTPTWRNDPNWLIFFKWVESTS